MRRKTITKLFLSTLGIAVLVAGCSTAKKDEAIATDIQARMFSDAQVKSANVAVSVKDGEATLSGNVPDDGARYHAYKIASDTPGVKHVVDQMTVQTQQVAQPAETAPAMPHPMLKSSSESAKKHIKSEKKFAKRNPAPEPEPASTPAPPPLPPAVQTASATAPPPAPVVPTPPPPPQPRQVEIPAGTSVRVQMVDSVDSSTNHTGNTFHATLATPIVVDNQIVVPSGTDVYVKLTNAKSAGRMTGQSTLALELSRMEFQGKSYSLSSNDYTQTGSSRGKRTAETVGGGAVLGTLLGAVIGHGKGAAIGAATGAAAGGVAEGATKGQQIQIPSETKLDFSLEGPVDVSYFPDRNRSQRP